MIEEFSDAPHLTSRCHLPDRGDEEVGDMHSLNATLARRISRAMLEGPSAVHILSPWPPHQPLRYLKVYASIFQDGCFRLSRTQIHNLLQEQKQEKGCQLKVKDGKSNHLLHRYKI